MTFSGTFNEVLYKLAQDISPDDDSTLNEEIIEAAVEMGVPNATNVNAAVVGMANALFVTQYDSPGPALNALADDARSPTSVAAALLAQENGNLLKTESGNLLRVE